MILRIVFAPSARISLVSIIKFIKEKWGKKSSDKFKAQVDKTLKTISKQPYIFKSSALAQDIRKGIISKQPTFFYKIYPDRLEIIFFWDNRQEPFID